MKLTIATLLFTLCLVTNAQARQHPNKIVFSYECKQIDPAKTGFECHFNKKSLKLSWVKNPDDMSADKKEYALYEFNKIALRFFDLGGKRFYVRDFGWDKNRIRVCGHTVVEINGRRQHIDYSYTCSN